MTSRREGPLSSCENGAESAEFRSSDAFRRPGLGHGSRYMGSHLPGTEPKVKTLCGNAYEHFEFSGSYSVHGEEQLPVYRWCRRTYVDEY